MAHTTKLPDIQSCMPKKLEKREDGKQNKKKVDATIINFDYSSVNVSASLFSSAFISFFYQTKKKQNKNARIFI